MKQVLSFLLLLCSINSFAQTLEGDRLALVALYNAAGGPNWYSERDNPWPLPSQPGDSPCGWFGVTCENGRVVSIDLGGNELSGQLPPEIGNLTALRDLSLANHGLNLYPPLTGKIPAEFANLTNLENLNLVDNFFGMEGIDVLWGITSLKTLSFTPLWPISESIGNLTNLESLSLLAGRALPSIPNLGNLPSAIGSMTTIKTLSIQTPGFSGAIPGWIGNLVNLNSLTITYAGFSGQIPKELGNLVNATSIMLAGIRQSGNVPAEIGNLAKLNTLVITDCELSGSLPATINNLTQIRKMVFSENNLGRRLPNVSNFDPGALTLYGNKFTYDGLEENFPKLSSGIQQQNLPITINNKVLSVYAGGTLANNTYRWYRFGELVATKTGDSTFVIQEDGNYYVTVNNSVVTTLMLVSETYSATLPVTLVDFRGKSESNQTKLTWKTTSETNNKGFEIERSADARTFEKIGFVDGSGDTKDDQFYHFTDLSPLATGYYRLKQLDYDGKFEHSKVIVVRAGKAVINIYPNPAQTELTVEGTGGNDMVSVFTPTGRSVVTDAALVGGKLDLKDLKEGIYTIKIGDVAKKLLIKR
ncbi:T9SS type A sorting domain-containing protein [Dyadobacter endophyticus]|uniref:T9SS type A sorting domain-containing protein n=1 Tax=Dyadobacter endophyticus TaxID=1749036 RepID=UPI003CEB5724